MPKEPEEETDLTFVLDVIKHMEACYAHFGIQIDRYRKRAEELKKPKLILIKTKRRKIS